MLMYHLNSYKWKSLMLNMGDWINCKWTTPITYIQLITVTKIEGSGYSTVKTASQK